MSDGAARGRPGITGIVLAGGESTRFGRPKWRARLPDGTTLLDRAVGALAGWCHDVLVAGRDEALSAEGLPGGARFVQDLPLGRGPLVGIATGLEASRTALTAVVACDMPFADGELLRSLAGMARGYDAVVPVSDHGLEPLHAVYRRSCLEPMRAALGAGVRAPTDVLEGSDLSVRRVDVDGRRQGTPYTPFFSVNTPDDLRRARERLARVTPPST